MLFVCAVLYFLAGFAIMICSLVLKEALMVQTIRKLNGQLHAVPCEIIGTAKPTLLFLINSQDIGMAMR